MAFDIDRFTRESDQVDWRDLDFDSFERSPLPAQTLRTLRYMCEVEFHTVCYLRDLLVTPSRHSEQVGAFMTMWNREEFWHGQALAAVLDRHGISVRYDELKARRVKLGWRDRLNPVKQAVLGNVLGKDFVAVHMIWGAVNEWSAGAAYKRLAALEDHPELAVLLSRIAAQEAKHVAFYATQARTRLEASAKARTLARLALEHTWGPVGSTILPDEEVVHVMGHLFGGPEGRKEIDAIDKHIARLPGMQGLSIVADAMRVRGVYP